MERDDFGHLGAWIAVFSLAVALPIVAVLLSYWLLGITLPTLLFISFVMLLLGSMACWPAPDRETTSPESLILLILGQSSGVGVLIIFFVRLWIEGMLFRWI